jgi:hypothetical protein
LVPALDAHFQHRELTNAMLKVLPAEQAQALMDEQMSMLEARRVG